jgi:hypothetical protein
LTGILFFFLVKSERMDALLCSGVTRTVSLDGTQQYTSIQTAINACNNGDSVLVYPGRYIENINLNGHNVTLASLYFQTSQQTDNDDNGNVTPPNTLS